MALQTLTTQTTAVRSTDDNGYERFQGTIKKWTRLCAYFVTICDQSATHQLQK